MPSLQVDTAVQSAEYAISAPPSPSAAALLSLTQDVSALISLSVEATASLVNDWFRSTLSTIGLASSAGTSTPRSNIRGESGRGLAVVVVGAGEATGQSLTLHLAKSGYTVFPLVPLPSPHSPPTSTALSTLLLTWSGIQKRLRSRNPSHPGNVVPVLTDPETEDFIRDIKGKGRFRHAGETVRAYCRENNLVLISIVCASRPPRVPTPPTAAYHHQSQHQHQHHNPVMPDSPDMAMIEHYSEQERPSSPTITTTSVPLPLLVSPRLVGLAATDEATLLGLYRTNILDPLSVIKELSDMLEDAQNSGKGRGRVVFVNGPDTAEEGSFFGGAVRMIGSARAEGTRLLCTELGKIGIDVCEVVVGPMASPPVMSPAYQIRQAGEDQDEDNTEQKLLTGSESEAQLSQSQSQKIRNRNAILASRIAFLSRLWAVDDALLFSAVRRAIEDRYPRYRHHAGLSPLLESIADATPGGGLVKVVGRWVLGRLLMPRSR